jgi:hypothetical protein
MSRDSSEAAVLAIAGFPHAAQKLAEAVRRDPEWKFERLPASFALAHAAGRILAERRGFLDDCHRRLPPPYDGLVAEYAAAFMRVAAERAALDGDENALAALAALAHGSPLDEQTREMAAADVEGALVRMSPPEPEGEED